MGSCLEERGHIAILIYFALFGSCYVVSSSFYLFSLDKFTVPNNESETICVPGVDDTSGDPLANCVDFNSWKILSLTGIVYGALCLLLGVIKLCRIIKRSCCSTTVVIQKPASRSQPTLRSAAGGNVVRKANAGVRRLVIKDEQKRSWSTVCSSCCHCLSSCSLFFLVVILWIISVAVPGFLAVNLYTTNAIRAKDDSMYIPAMALFATCLTSFTAVCVSCVFIVLESEREWSHAVLDDEESKEMEDPENVTASQPLRPTTTTATNTNDTNTPEK